MRAILVKLSDAAHHTTRRSNTTSPITIARTSGSAILTSIKIYQRDFQKIADKDFDSCKIHRWPDAVGVAAAPVALVFIADKIAAARLPASEGLRRTRAAKERLARGKKGKS
jgi:hypothetical protein